ncbi:hypothetical protein [Nocardia nova]|uniref:hypothetical protein n=1 Tax=Nocardia nova TaxID=37330 RepID=UPI0018932008|nr:hypothetical protein [Nocardia nova]MBF6277047.1 hypothetical protein [Nocardia nova]
MSTPNERWYGTGAHRTRTIEWVTGERYKTKSNGSCGRWVDNTFAKAVCVCGWSEYAEDRADARWRARNHRDTANAAPVRTYYQVTWGTEESDSISYIDDGDGSWLSEDARQRAERKLLELIRAGVRAGLYVDGKFAGGCNMLASSFAIEDGRMLWDQHMTACVGSNA